MDLELLLYVEPLSDSRVRASLLMDGTSMGPDFGPVILNRDEATELLHTATRIVKLAGSHQTLEPIGSLHMHYTQALENVLVIVRGMGIEESQAALAGADVKLLEFVLDELFRFFQRAHEMARRLSRN